MIIKLFLIMMLTVPIVYLAVMLINNLTDDMIKKVGKDDSDDGK